MMTKKMGPTDQHGLQIIMSAWYYSVIKFFCLRKAKVTASRKIHFDTSNLFHRRPAPYM